MKKVTLDLIYETLLQHSKKLDLIDTRMSTLEESMDMLEKRMDNLEKRMGGQDDRMDSFEGRFKGIENKLDILLWNQQQLQKEVKNLTEVLEDLVRNVVTRSEIADFSRLNNLKLA